MSTTEEEKALYDAVTDLDEREVRRLISKGVSSTGYKNNAGRTAITYAVMNGNIDCLKLLIDSGGDINVRDNSGWTAILWAAVYHDIECLKLLIDSGGDINVRDNDGKTAIMKATSNNHIDILKLLIDSGGDINVRDNDGWTAIIYAALFGYIDILMLLVESGGDINVRDNCGKCAMNYAAEEDRYECSEYLRQRLMWLSRRGFLMFLATQSYLPAAPPPFADSMSSDELNVYYQKFHNSETRPNTAVHSVFFMQELQRYIMSFLGNG